MKTNGGLHSLRFRLPMLLMVYCGLAGVVLYAIASKYQEGLVEQEFLSRQLIRATDLQGRTERAAERSELETGQREFGELASLEEVRSAVLISPDDRVLLTSRREWLNQRVDLTAIGVATPDLQLVETTMAQARTSQAVQTYFTQDRTGLVVILPAALPLVPNALEVDRRALILVVFDMSHSKAVNRYRLRRQFTIAGFTFLLAAFGLGVGVHLFVTRRLELLQTLMSRFEAGEALLEQAKPHADDEIAHIQEQFSSMAVAVRREMGERQQAETELLRVNRALRTISNCSQALVHATDEQALLDEVCRVIVTDGGYRFAWVALPIDPKSATIRAVAHQGFEDGYLEVVESVWASGRSTFGPTRTALRSGQPFVCRDYATDPNVAEWREQALKRGYRSSVTFPLVSGGAPLGALLIYSGEVNAFDEGEMALLGEMAEDLAYGLQALRTHRKQGEAEHALRESQAKLVLAMDMARLAPWEFDVATETFVFNDTFYAQLRTTAAAEGGMEMPADVYSRKFIPAGEQNIVREEIDKALATTDPNFTRRLEHRILRADGSVGMVLVRFAIVKDASGRTVRTYGVNQDITERRQADEALRISEERFRSALNHSPIGMAIVAPDGRFSEVNPALCNIVGYTRDELVRTRFQAITHPEDLSRDLDLVQQLLDRKIEAFQVEKRYIHKRGFIIWTQQNLSLVRDEYQRPRYFVKQVQDITERKRAAAELLSLNERYARHEAALAVLTRSSVSVPGELPAVMRNVMEVVARTLEVVRVGVWCPAEQTGELVCLDLFDASSNRHIPGPSWSAAECQTFGQVLTAAEVTVTYDVTRTPKPALFADSFLRAGGIVSVMDVPIRSQGRLVGVMCCMHIGEPRKWTPDEQTFSVAVGNLLSSLISQVEQQKLEERLRQSQKLEGIGQLAGGVAHDFNNLLTVILGKAGQLAEDRRMPGDLRDAAEEISHSGQRAANLTRQLLAFSRQQAMEKHDVDLNAVVGSLARMLERILGEHLTVQFSFAAEPAVVRADPGMVDQVLLNLAVNARDAMPGGGRLLIETSLVDLEGPSTAGGSVHPPGAYVCMRVQDTGSGIAPEHLPHIFEPFFTTKDVGKGTGLGLATSYGIVQQHEGWIEVDSRVGEGTTFSVFLPRLVGHLDAPVVAPRAPSVGARPASVDGQETILVVEDEDAVRSLIVEALSGFGYRVYEAPSGPLALEVWREHGASVDLLITDMVMPGGVNGLDLAFELKRTNPALGVIYISGYLADISRDDLLKAEGAAYLAKPFSLPALVRLVRERLDAVARA